MLDSSLLLLRVVLDKDISRGIPIAPSENSILSFGIRHKESRYRCIEAQEEINAYLHEEKVSLRGSHWQ